MTVKSLCTHAGRYVRRGVVFALSFVAAGQVVKANPDPHLGKDPFRMINWELISAVDKGLKTMAIHDARYLAAIYAQSDRQRFPGIVTLGRTLTERLEDSDKPLDFEKWVSRNPDFWRAERELNFADVSLPYFVAMLSVLSGDQLTAIRLLSISQASMPFTPSVRRAYARPESLLKYQSYLMLSGTGAPRQWQTVALCDYSEWMLTQRIRQWPKQVEILAHLIEVVSQRVRLQNPEGNYPEKTLIECMNLSSEDVAFIGEQDPILLPALDSDIGVWLRSESLMQRWLRWLDHDEPAEVEEIEDMIDQYQSNGRMDVAWLLWRQKLVLNPLVSEQESQRWKLWCQGLIGEEATRHLIESIRINPFAGLANLMVPYDEKSEGWSGDQEIHPMLVVQVERQLAMIDTSLRLIKLPPIQEIKMRSARTGILTSIGAFQGAREELNKMRSLFFSSRLSAKDFTELKYTIDELNASLLEESGDYEAAGKIFEGLMAEQPTIEVRRRYARFEHTTQDYEVARKVYLELAERDTDPEYTVYWPLMAHLSALRMGSDERAALQSYRGKVVKDSWIDYGYRYLLGELSEEVLLKRAKVGTLYDVIQQQCEASFWIAQVALAEGDEEKGILWLRRCVSTGYSMFVEYEIAQAELKRFEALRPDEGPKEKPKRNYRGNLAA